MAGSSFGTIFKITTWGESHGKALGVVIDGCPAGLALSENDIQPYLDRRKPGNASISTPRKESDHVEILSGVFEGKTTGCPISLMIPNTSAHSNDYDEIASYYRPGHADFTFDNKYGFRDYRGGGRSSGRETAGRVAAGAIACKILNEMGITVTAYTKSIGSIEADCSHIDVDTIHSSETAMPDLNANQKALAYINDLKMQGDSTGGVMECHVYNLPCGIGDPVFDKLDANISKAIMSIGAVKAVEIGDGTIVSTKKGSENNDNLLMCNNKLCVETNHAGGVLGGISTGQTLIIRAHVKPTPSIIKSQETVKKDGTQITVSIKGRHDPVIVPRAVVVMESMVALTILDSLMINMSAKLEKITDFYHK